MIPILNLIKGSPLKLLVILAFISSIAGYVLYDRQQRFEAGYNTAKAEYLEQLNVAQIQADGVLEASLKKLREQIAEKQRIVEENRLKAIQLQSKLNDRPTVEIIREIESITSDCTDLGDDYWRLQDNIIGTAPDASK